MSTGDYMKETKKLSTGPGTSTDVIDPKFFNLVSQFAHFFAMYALTFTAGKFWHWRGIELVGGLCVLYAAIKEFWFDARYENQLTRGSDLEDFIFLVLGVAVAAG